MSTKLSHWAERRAGLVAQAAMQRTTLASEMKPWRARLALVDQGMAVIRHLKRHPALWLGSALLLAAWRPKSAATWMGRAWGAWRLGRSLNRR